MKKENLLEGIVETDNAGAAVKTDLEKNTEKECIVNKLPDEYSSREDFGKDVVKKNISGSTLKLVAIGTMLIDHIGATVVERKMLRLSQLNWKLEFIDIVLRLIGRLGFPLFCFLLVEGFTHTRNRAKYIRRMILFGFVSEIPFDLAFSDRLIDLNYQNVFFTLTLGLLCMCCIDSISKKTFSGIGAAILKQISFFLAGFMAFWLYITSDVNSLVEGITGYAIHSKMVHSVLIKDIRFKLFGVKSIHIDKMYYVLPNFRWILIGSIVGVVSVLILNIVLHNKDKAKVTSTAISFIPTFALIVIGDLALTDYAAWGVFTVVCIYLLRRDNVKAMKVGCTTLTIMQFMECTAFLTVPIVKHYNGKRGLKLKYVFYLFYPVHLLILEWICRMLLLRVY